jgi:hypothetical protein
VVDHQEEAAVAAAEEEEEGVGVVVVEVNLESCYDGCFYDDEYP